MYLLDTNVISAGAPAGAAPSAALIGWMERHSQHLYLSVMTIAEIEDCIAKARREGAARKAERLGEWLETLLHLYSARILPLDLAAARVLGRRSDTARGAGQSPGLADLAIAATARARGYTVLTRNARHFACRDVPSHDPFESLPTPR